MPHRGVPHSIRRKVIFLPKIKRATGIERREGSPVKKLVPLVGLILATCLGCASTAIVRTGSDTPPPKPDGCAIDVFAAEADVKRPFERVCLIDVETGSTLYHHKTPEAAMKRMKKAACKCGADAVILTDLTRKGVNAWNWGHSGAKAIGVRYIDTPVSK
jgi:hypothetical protein